MALVGLLLLAPAVRADPDDQAEALRLLDAGIAAFQRGDLEQARATIARARDLVPERANPYRWLGLVEAGMGRCEEAIRDLDAFIARVPVDDPRLLEASTLRDRCQSELDHAVRLREEAVRAGARKAPPAPAPLPPEQVRRRALLGVAAASALVGAGLFAGGVYYGVHGQSLSEEASHATSTWSTALDGVVADGAAANRNFAILASVGAALVATAAVLTAVALGRRWHPARAARDGWRF
jgi:hypothetical protein